MSLTLLNEDLDTTETGVDVSPSLTAANRPEYILIDSEIMAVASGTSTLTVTRAQFNTVGATHANTTPIYEVVSVITRADSLLVYYYADDGSQAIKDIIQTGATTQTLPSAAGATDGSTLEIVGGAYTIVPANDAGEGGMYAVEGHITEAGAGTYTMSFPVLAGSRLYDIYWYTDTAFGAATSATLEAGVTGTLNGFMTGVNCKAQGAGTTHAGTGTLWGTSNEGAGPAGKAGYLFPADTDLIVTVVTVGAGTTGRFRASAVLHGPITVLEATKT